MQEPRTGFRLSPWGTRSSSPSTGTQWNWGILLGLQLLFQTVQASCRPWAVHENPTGTSQTASRLLQGSCMQAEGSNPCWILVLGANCNCLKKFVFEVGQDREFTGHMTSDFVLLLELMQEDKFASLYLFISQSVTFRETKYLLSALLWWHFFSSSSPWYIFPYSLRNAVHAIKNMNIWPGFLDV